MSKEGAATDRSEDDALSLFFTPDDMKMDPPEKTTFKLGHVGWYVHTKMNMASMRSDSQQGGTQESSMSDSLLTESGVEITGEQGNLVKCENEDELESTETKSKSPATPPINVAPPLLKIKSSNGLSLYFCNECPYNSNFKRSVNRHIESVHMGLRSFKCPFCEYKANYMSNVKRHVSSVHDGERRFACPRCDYRTSDKGHLSSHIKAVHDKLKPFQCKECKYHASKRTDLNIHIKAVHEREKPHRCPYCTYQASKQCNLKRHVKNIHEDPQPAKKKNLKNDHDAPQTDSEQREPKKPKSKRKTRKSSSSGPQTSRKVEKELAKEKNIDEGANNCNLTKTEYFRQHLKIKPTSKTVTSESSSSKQSETVLNTGLETSLSPKVDKSKINLVMDMMANREIEISIVPKSQ